MISFNDLSSNEKAALIWRNALFVTSRHTSHTRYNLFSLSGIFIEIGFNRMTNQVENIIVLNPCDLDHYVNDLDISEIL